jgi:hypothetical protein
MPTARDRRNQLIIKKIIKRSNLSEIEEATLLAIGR